MSWVIAEGRSKKKFCEKYRKIFDLIIDYEFTSFYEKNNLLFPPRCLF